MTAPSDSVIVHMTDEDKQDRALRAIQVAATTGFIGSVHSIQTSCLSLCNTCREHVLLQRLTISAGVPPSVLAIVCPGVQPADAERSSRVSRNGRVLSVYWTFGDSRRYDRPAMETEVQTDDAGREWRSVDARNRDRSADILIDIGDVQWPEGTKQLALRTCNRRLDAMPLPEGLEKLWFGQPTPTLSMTSCRMCFDIFNMPLDGLVFPCCLREMFLGNRFNQPIEGVAWPGGLERLSLPGFNQSIRDAKLPPGLKALEFVSPSTMMLWEHMVTLGSRTSDSILLDREVLHFTVVGNSNGGHGKFNQPLGTTLPPGLETLWLSNDFVQPLDDVSWPSGLVSLGLAFDFQLYCYPESVTWPSNLRELFVVNKPDHKISYPQGSGVTILNTFEEGLCSICDAETYDPGDDPNDEDGYVPGSYVL